MKNVKRFLAAAAGLVLLTTCCLPASGQKPAGPRQLAETWIACLNRHDTLALAALYDDSARLRSPNWEGVRTGPAAVREVYRRYFTGTPDLEHQLTHLVCTDSSIVIEYLSRGTFLHPEEGTPAYMKGKRYELQNCTRLDLSKGKIIRQVNYFDQVSFLRQMGFFDQLGK